MGKIHLPLLDKLPSVSRLKLKPRTEEEIITRASVAFKQFYKNVEFENVSGDICNQQIDAIVNPANSQLLHNNGISSAIIQKGGEIIQKESEKIMDETNGILDVGTAVVTTGGNLQAKYIIHVVTPIWSGGEHGEEEKLGETIHNALVEADKKKISGIAVPCLSGGGFGFPREISAEIIVKYSLKYFDQNPESSIKLIRFVNMDSKTVKAFKIELEKLMENSLVGPSMMKRSINNKPAIEKNENEILTSSTENDVPESQIRQEVPQEQSNVEKSQPKTESKNQEEVSIPN